jgi:N-methylhydantoinase A
VKYTLGIDVGGTFTDLVCIDENGRFIIRKTPSTPIDPSEGMMDGIAKLAYDLGKSRKEFLRDVIRICHGTTVSTNTVLTRRGAKVGLLVTKGFRDMLRIRLRIRENIYDYTVPQPKPLAPRYLTMPIEERIKWNGEVFIPLNEDEVRRACKHFKEKGVEAIAICFFWSFKNSSHEKRAVAICREELPDLYICGSHEVQPEIREYWRMSTTVVNAYVGPALSRYITRLTTSLEEAGFIGQLLITQSNAGAISPQIACEQAVRTLISGPACAPAAAAHLTKDLNIDNLITIDIGGTSFDVCLVKEGKPTMTLESSIDGVYHIRLPMVDVHTIGAGGGSVAWLDSMKVLHVGPQSAGANPGPACYGKGGLDPTVTDADLVLGYLNPGYFLGGEIRLDIDLAKKAIKEKIADPLGMELPEAARSIVAVVDHTMVNGISAISVQRGEDPRGYTLVAAGGAGPVHAVSLAKELGIKQIIVPRTSSIFCALGSVIADIRHDYVKSVYFRTDGADLNSVMSAFTEMEDKGDDLLEKEGVPKEDRYYKRSMDMRYKGQFHEVEVSVSPVELTKGGMKQVIERFHKRHEALYGYKDVTMTEIINLRLSAFGKIVAPSRRKQDSDTKDTSNYLKGHREALLGENGEAVRTPIYDGDSMGVGNIIKGPAIIEQATTTIVVPGDSNIEVTPYLDFMIYIADSNRKGEKNA